MPRDCGCGGSKSTTVMYVVRDSNGNHAGTYSTEVDAAAEATRIGGTYRRV